MCSNRHIVHGSNSTRAVWFKCSITICPKETYLSISLRTAFLASLCLAFVIVLFCSPNCVIVLPNIFVCDQCISTVTGSFICTVNLLCQFLRVEPAHSHVYTFSSNSCAFICSIACLWLIALADLSPASHNPVCSMTVSTIAGCLIILNKCANYFNSNITREIANSIKSKTGT